MIRSAILFPSPWFQIHVASYHWVEYSSHVERPLIFYTNWHKVTHFSWLCLMVLQEHTCKCNWLLFFLFGNGAQIPNVSNSLIILFVTYELLYNYHCRMNFYWTLGFIVLVLTSSSWGFHTFGEIHPQTTYPENGYWKPAF